MNKEVIFHSSSPRMKPIHIYSVGIFFTAFFTLHPSYRSKKGALESQRLLAVYTYYSVV